MRGRKALLLGLTIVLVFTAFAAVSCGGDDSAAKASLLSAVTKVETGVAGLQTQFTEGGTVPELKAAKDAMAVDWQAVVTAAKSVNGADPVAAEKAWTDVDAAINALPDDIPLIQAATSIMGPIQALMAQAAELKKLAGPSE